MKTLYFILILTICHQSLVAQWTYAEIDNRKQKWGDWEEPAWLRYFGLDAGDVDGDGDMDILSGRYLYHNPGVLQSPWKRTVLDDNVDGIFILDVDGDSYADLIAQSLPDLYWYEAIDKSATRFVRQKIAEVPATTHVNSQGFEMAQIIPGGKEEILIAGNGNVYVIQIPEDPTPSWKTNLIAANTSDEGIGIGDIDGDGLNDIVCGRRPDGKDEPTILVWFKNPGSVNSQWTHTEIGNTNHPIDRIKVGDLDGDGIVDVVLSEERYPGLEPDANIFWFSQNKNTNSWDKHFITEQYSTNNLDLADMDEDGDLDIIAAEHKGEMLELQLWNNTGNGKFTKTVLDTGKENHLGAQVYDLDHDGDLDIIGAAWDNYKYMHVWRNDRVANEVAPEVAPGLVKAERILDTLVTQYQGRDHFVIKTKQVTYYYDIKGGGFSRMIDLAGNDWISFKITSSDYPQGASGMFRGIPNLVYKGEMNGAGHPGFNQCQSWFEDGILYSESSDKKWKWAWTFGESMATLEILNYDPSRNYWFLYEGTPAGRFTAATSYFGYDGAGPIHTPPDFYNDSALFTPITWAYVGSKNTNRILFMAHATSDNTTGILSYLGSSSAGLESKDGMTVFGFGRGQNTDPLLQGEHKFIIGIYPSGIESTDDHEAFSKFINLQLK